MPNDPSRFANRWRNEVQLTDCHKLPIEKRLEIRQQIFADWNSAKMGPAPIWYPTPEIIEQSNLNALMLRSRNKDLDSLRRWWQDEPGAFWSTAIEMLDIKFKKPARTALEFDDPRDPTWLRGAKLNIVESCFRADGDSVAIKYAGEDGILHHLTSAELLQAVRVFAARIESLGFSPKDRLAIVMPMNVDSVVTYLGILYAGCTAVSIADSFSPQEIAKRIMISQAKGIFFCESYRRSGKTIDLEGRILQAKSICDSKSIDLRVMPVANLTADVGDQPISSLPTCHDADHIINVLFSSGTTGDPKAIPWDQTTPIKCAADGMFHHNIKQGDIVVWPTNLGWMMGPWLIFATLMNRATIGLFEDAPTGAAFGKFVQDSKTTMLGVVPAIVRHWKKTRCMETFDWSSIQCFSSTGEASNETDMIYLSALAGFRPIIEYCGGTEIGGGYISSTVVEPNVPAAFSTAAVGSRFEILDDQFAPTDEGELFLVPPSMGLSQKLLNRDHFKTYYAGLPKLPDGKPLRRHGDRIQRLPGGYFRACGRNDDTMNPGGIKIGSAEIETVLNRHDLVVESAVIAESKDENGNSIPDRLVAFVVSESDIDLDVLRSDFNAAIRECINPLIRIYRVTQIEKLPRTASNKIMHRELRDRS